MDWMNLHISTLDSAAFKGAEPVDRATWLCLLRFCVGQENGGVIAEAATWGDRKWQQLCGVTKTEALRKCELWAWVGDGLTVAFYPADKEAEVKAKRMAGRATATARWGSSANSSAIEKLDREGRNSNENEIEVEGNGVPALPPISFSGKTTPIDTAKLLAEFGLPSARWHVTEWRGGLNKIARCKSLPEARAFLEWALGVCKSQGVQVEYFRHVKPLACEWDDGARTQHFGVASEA